MAAIRGLSIKPNDEIINYIVNRIEGHIENAFIHLNHDIDEPIHEEDEIIDSYLIDREYRMKMMIAANLIGCTIDDIEMMQATI
jgi:hypothetical protein